jgi:hypothetical protein
MTTLHEKRAARHFKVQSDVSSEQREHRRYDLGGQTLSVNRWDANRRATAPLGYLMDLSAGGVRVRTDQDNIKADSQIRVRLELPSYAGISPFIDTAAGQPQAKTEWIGWLAVSRVKKVDGKHFDVSGRLIDMDEMDRGMLGLYLSTQPLAA